MAEKIIDPGFELNDPAWLFVTQDGSNNCGRDTDAAHEDTWGCRTKHWPNTDPTLFGQHISIQSQTDLRDFSWFMRIWNIPPSGRDDFLLKLYLFPDIIDPISNYFAFVGEQFYDDTWDADDVPEAWTEYSTGLVAPTNTSITIIFVLEHSAVPAPVDPVGWDFDTLSYLTELELRGYGDPYTPVNPTYSEQTASSAVMNPAETPVGPTYSEKSSNDPEYT